MRFFNWESAAFIALSVQAALCVCWTLAWLFTGYFFVVGNAESVTVWLFISEILSAEMGAFLFPFMFCVLPLVEERKVIAVLFAVVTVAICCFVISISPFIYSLSVFVGMCIAGLTVPYYSGCFE